MTNIKTDFKRITNKLLLFLSFLILSFGVKAQNEFSKWYFGQNAGLDFLSSPPTILTNGSIGAGEGVASISDAFGNFLFSTDGTGVANSNNSLMANGMGLFGHQSTTQSALIVKQPGNTNIYYIFTLDQVAGTNGACYSIVDMNLAAGLGSVTVKNATLYAPSCEKQVAVRHCNGKDVWIMSHEYGSNKFRSYLLTAAGVNTVPIISAVSETVIGSGYATLGQLKVSPDGRKLAMATSSNSIPSSSGLGGFQLFDFDAASGIVSNLVSLNTRSYAYGVEFSPDGSKLYGAIPAGNSSVTATLFQWNICVSNPSLIAASAYSINLGSNILGSLQRAIDGKVYLAVSGQQSISVINNPNNSGAAMNFVLNGQSIFPKYSTLGLPNYINPYTKPTPAPFSNSLACQTASFVVPPVPTFSSGCSSTPYAPSSYLWDFGEPGSGTANSSTLTNPSHYYANTGTYTVSLILFNNCTNDTLKQLVNVITLGPNPSVAGTFTLCKGEKQTYTVSGGSSYLWFNNATTNTISLSPTSNTVYSVKTTSNGCSLSKSFSVTVNPCLGIAGLDYARPDIRFFPNPVNNELTLLSSIASTIVFYDVSGRIVLESKIEEGENKISTINLKAGLYTLQVVGTSVASTGSASGVVWRGRLVKIND